MRPTRCRATVRVYRLTRMLLVILSMTSVTMTAPWGSTESTDTGEAENERPIALSTGDWEVRARSMQIDARNNLLIVSDAVARRGSWWLAADRLEIMSGRDTLGVRATGTVRVAGPERIYVIGPNAEFDQDTLVLKADRDRPSLVGTGYSLFADVIRVNIEERAVSLHGVTGRD